MGLFDRIKKAFRHDKKNEKELEKNINESNEQLDSEQIETVQESQASDISVEENELTSAETELEEVDSVQELKSVEAVVEEDKTTSEETELESVDTIKESKSVETVVEEDKTTSEETELESVDTVKESKSVETVVEEDKTTSEETELESVDIVKESKSVEKVDEEDKTTSVETELDQTEDLNEDLLQDNPDNDKYDKGLEKTRKTFGEKLNELFARFRTVDEDFFDELEETLILSDVGLDISVQLTEELRQEVKLKNVKKTKDIQNTIIEKLVSIYEQNDQDNQKLHLSDDGLSVILFVGVNGAGKTTTIGKMANQFKEQNKKVILAAADTFRAGAINQLVQWGERSQVPVVAGKEGGDPAAVVYDAVFKAKETDADILLVDTAGRLQNKDNLMRELNKIKRVIQKEIPEAPHEVLLVIDATTGQNALVQAKKFNETTDVTGLVLTKLDGTAKGGIILAIKKELNIPVKFVGLGEKINDLAPFDSEQFIYGLFKDLWVEE